MNYDRRGTIYLTLVFRSVLFYFLLIISLRVMGKREVGELSIFDLAIFIVMSELLAIAISDSEEALLRALIPMITLTILQISLSYVILKSRLLRGMLDGKPVFIIYDGVLQQAEMRKQRYSIDDLCSQLRNCGITDIREILHAMLENNGSLSIIRKNQKLLYPDPLIQDGEINNDALQRLNITSEWLKDQVQRRGINQIESIFICMLFVDELYIVKKGDTHE